MVDAPHEDREERFRSSVQPPVGVFHFEPFGLGCAQTLHHRAHLLQQNNCESVAITRFVKGVVKDGRRGAEAPQIFGTIKTSALSTMAILRFASVVLDSVLRPPHLARHT